MTMSWRAFVETADDCMDPFRDRYMRLVLCVKVVSVVCVIRNLALDQTSACGVDDGDEAEAGAEAIRSCPESRRLKKLRCQ